MYRIYTTEGIVLKGFATGEASKILAVFTRDLGLLYARAQSVREERSKLRYCLQDFSLGSFDLVRGKSGWRVTSAAGIRTLADFRGERRREAQGILVRVSALLVRLLRGEEKDPALFEEVVGAFARLGEREAPHGSPKDFEALLVMRILSRLGYWGDDPVLSPFIHSFQIGDKETFAAFAPVRGMAIRRINASLRETQL